MTNLIIQTILFVVGIYAVIYILIWISELYEQNKNE